MSDAPEDGRPSRHRGVHKGPAGSAVEPVNSAGGRLFLAVLVSLISIVIVGAGIRALINDEVPSWVGLIMLFAIVLLTVPTSWASYLKARKAVRLRRASGKTLQHPPAAQ